MQGLSVSSFHHTPEMDVSSVGTRLKKHELCYTAMSCSVRLHSLMQWQSVGLRHRRTRSKQRPLVSSRSRLSTSNSLSQIQPSSSQCLCGKPTGSVLPEHGRRMLHARPGLWRCSSCQAEGMSNLGLRLGQRLTPALCQGSGAVLLAAGSPSFRGDWHIQ